MGENMQAHLSNNRYLLKPISDHSDSASLDLRMQPPAQAALHPCVYLGMQCSTCGQVRQALSLLPDSATIACPACGRLCDFILLGAGLTTRKLPFHEIVHEEKQTIFTRRQTPLLTPTLLPLDRE